MGRKKRKTVRPRPRPRLPTLFECPICTDYSPTPTMTIDIDRRKGIAIINCPRCGFKQVRTIRKIDERVDIYSKLIDEVEAAREKGEPYPPAETSST